MVLGAMQWIGLLKVLDDRKVNNKITMMSFQLPRKAGKDKNWFIDSVVETVTLGNLY